MRALLYLLFGLAPAGAVAAQSTLLDGHTITVSDRIQLSPTFFSTFSTSVVVGAGVEVTSFALNGYMQIDLSDRQIVVTATAQHTTGFGELLGFADFGHEISDFVVVTHSSSWGGFGPDSTVWLNDDDFTLTFSPGATVAPGSSIVVNINPAPVPSDVFCVPGEAGVIDCPCMPPYTVPRRPHAPASGCPNSIYRGGARLEGFGVARPFMDFDTLVLVVSGVPDVLTIFIESDALLPSAVPFGDGVTCIGGNQVRFGERIGSGGDARYPRPGELRISQITQPPFGAMRYYQAIYRNARADWCSPPTFNVSNGFSVLWH